MAIQNVVLVGGAGRIGTHILQGLRDAAFNVTVVSRKSSKSSFPSGVKVVTVEDDYTHEELVSAFRGNEAVVAAVAGPAVKYQKTMIDAAIEAGVSRFLPSEFGAYTSPENARNNVALAPKLEIREYLSAKESTGLTWSGLATDAFFEMGLSNGFLRYDLKNQKAVIMDAGDTKWRSSTWRTIIAGVVGILKHPEETKNRIVFVHSFEFTQNELLAEFEKATGTKWQVEKLDGDAYKAEQWDLARKGEIKGVINLLWAEAIHGGITVWPEKSDNELLGVPKEDLGESIRHLLKEVA